MRIFRLLSSALVASALAACGGGMQGGIPTQNPVAQSSRALQPLAPKSSGITIPSRTMVKDGLTIHVFPGPGTKVLSDRVSAQQSGQPNLSYYGGPVQIQPQIFVVYWGPQWVGNPKGPIVTSNDPEYKIMNGFLDAIGGRAWLNIVTQYYQAGPLEKIPNPQHQLKGVWIDTSPIPQTPTYHDVATEAVKAAKHFESAGYALSVNNNYIVATPSGVVPEDFGTLYCGYHGTSNGDIVGGINVNVPYTLMPYVADQGPNCGAGNVNRPGTYDGVTVVVGHEVAETQTDPLPNSGWITYNYLEIGDKCVWRGLEDNPNAGGYPTQPLWDNKINACAQSGP